MTLDYKKEKGKQYVDVNLYLLRIFKKKGL